MPTIGVAIPCFKGHIAPLKRLLDSIENQTKKPDMVIISCSSSSYVDIPYKQENYTFPFKIYTHVQKMNAAQNRNFAANHLDTDIISFIDADDTMHPQRLEIIEKAFKENDIVLFLHSFLNNDDKVYETYNLETISFDTGKLRIQDGCEYGITHISKSNINLANGHCTVHQHIFKIIKYRESYIYHGKEDSIFTADILRNCPLANAYSNIPLTVYIPSNTLGYIS